MNKKHLLTQVFFCNQCNNSPLGGGTGEAHHSNSPLGGSTGAAGEGG